MTDVARPQAEPRRGWRRLLLALVAFVVLPASPFRLVLPIDETMMLFVPAMAVCGLLGWWAGGRPWSAILWVTLAVLVTRQDLATSTPFANMVRGWALLLAGAFGVACIIGEQRPVFTKAM